MVTKGPAIMQALLKGQEIVAKTVGRGNIEMQTLSTFFYIAAQGKDIPMQDLEDALGVSQAAVSRNVTLLSIGGARLPAPNLIEAFEDPEYRRRKYVRLTPKGRKLADQLADLFIATCTAR